MAIKQLFTSRLFWLVCYVIMVATIVIGIVQFRAWTGNVYSSGKANSEWQQWREDVKNQPEDAPVKRRIPKSQQPPALVLLNDYFWACLGISWLLSSALFVTFMVAVRGVILSPGLANSDSADSAESTVGSES